MVNLNLGEEIAGLQKVKMKNRYFLMKSLYLFTIFLLIRANAFEQMVGLVNAYQQPFLYVYGTISPNNYENNVIEKTTLDVINKWKIMRNRIVPVKKDVDVTQDDIQKFNLILYGNEHSNKIMKEIGKDMPIRITNDAIIVGDHKYTNWDEGAIFYAPNPLNPKKYVVIYGALTYHGFPHINSVNASDQDYVIFNNMTKFRIDQPIGTPLEQGYFDKSDPLHWKVKPTPKPPIHIVEETSFQPILASTTRQILEKISEETSYHPVVVSTTKIVVRKLDPAKSKTKTGMKTSARVHEETSFHPVGISTTSRH